MPLEDAIGVVGILMNTGRAVPPSKWVDVFMLAEEEMINEGLM
jgi:hypothetical protein